MSERNSAPRQTAEQLALVVGVTSDDLHAALAPYDGRCPLESCLAPLRVLGDPPRFVGCRHCDNLLRLVAEAAALGGAS